MMVNLLKMANFVTEENYEDNDPFSQYLKGEGGIAPPLSGHRLSQRVKIKAKNFWDLLLLISPY